MTDDKYSEVVEEIHEKLFNLKKFRKDDDMEPVQYYFRDGKRRIHYVIVIPDTSIYKHEAYKEVLRYLNFLEMEGLELECEIGITNANLIFIKVHASIEVIKQLANLYEIDIDYAGHNYIPSETLLNFKFQHTVLTKEHGDVFKRVGGPTSREIIFLIHKLLTDPLTFDEKEVHGMEKMIRYSWIKDAYALHDGPWQWAEIKHENLNDRQILSKYWANISMWYKRQPINLIEKYYGTDMAFYFAWCGHYNSMLRWVALVEIIMMIVNILHNAIDPPHILEQVCTSNHTLCPLCEDEKNCKYTKLSHYCGTTRAQYLLGNHINLVYAIFISIWVTIFLESWRRKEFTLKVRWNVHHGDVEYKVRYDYKDKSTYRRKSKITGNIEAYVPYGVRLWRYTVIYSIMFLMVIVVSVCVIILVMVKNVLIVVLRNEPEPTPALVAATLCSIFQVIFIRILSTFYIRLSVWLTRMEVPKTEKLYTDSVIYKIYILGFINNYIPILYTAFARGVLSKFLKGSLKSLFNKDVCLPTGCTLLLSIQLFIVLTLKSFGGNLFAAIFRGIRSFLISSAQSKTFSETQMYVPTWEKEFHLEEMNEEVWSNEFSEMVLQFGYVSFFMASFPLVGNIALLNNIIELRMDAIKLVRGHRRPSPSMMKSVGAWDEILKFASYFSIVCNAFVVAFNTQFIETLVYKSTPKFINSGGFLNFLFSEVDTNGTLDNGEKVTKCFYRGRNIDLEDLTNFELDQAFYWVSILKFGFVIIFENVILMIVAGIYYFVDEMPRRVKEQLHRERLYTKEVKLKLLDQKTRKSLVP